MKKNNKMFISNKLDSIIISAEYRIKNVRPGGKEIDPMPTVDWEDASEELKNNKHVPWFTQEATLMFPKRKYTFRKHTKEELEEIRLNQKWRLEQMFNYILNTYGWKSAMYFYNHKNWKEKIKNCGANINLNIPHCEYDKDLQCDIECPFFNTKCVYKED